MHKDSNQNKQRLISTITKSSNKVSKDSDAHNLNSSHNQDQSETK